MEESGGEWGREVCEMILSLGVSRAASLQGFSSENANRCFP